jgi:hypothetical protein
MVSNFIKKCQESNGELTTILVLDSGVPNINDLKEKILLDNTINFFRSPYFEKYCLNKSYLFKKKIYKFEIEDDYDNYDHQTNIHSIISSPYLGTSVDANIICGKIINKHGKAPLEMILEGLIYANCIKPDIVNISNGYSLEDLGKSNEYHIHDLIQHEIIKLHQNNIIVIASKKNLEMGFYPADFKEVISVVEYKKHKPNYADIIYNKLNFVVNTNYKSFNIKSGSSFMTAFITGIVSNYITSIKKDNDEIDICYIKKILSKMNETDLEKLYSPSINLTEMSPERINNLIKDFANN